MTIVEKIIAAHSDRAEVRPGEFVTAKVDLVMANDLTAGIAVDQFGKIGVEGVFDPKKVVFVMDHFVPNKDIATAEQVKRLREFAQAQGLIYLENVGIEHVVLPEMGLVLPGDLVVGADSHTCTYGALGAFATGMGSTDIAFAMATGEVWLKVPPTIEFLYCGKASKWVTGKDLILYTIGQIGVDGALYSAMEFTGDAVDALTMDERFTMANMAVEAGAKAGVFRVDDRTLDYVRARAERAFTAYESDPDAEYAQTIEIDASSLEPQISLPHSPDNVKPVSEVAGLRIDQAVIGSCTNGRLDDLRLCAEVLRGRRVHPRVRCIVIPGSQRVFLQAVREGLIEVFLEAGAVVSTPTCGPCVGGHMGIIASGERCISTTNRNFVGRMGSPEAEIFLSNPAVAAASAVTGEICHPEEVAKP
ncbi:MAG: 3-isopropylmalate dehydratase large subunit [Deltaproteobacteria bacterium]|nr:MAG: 3-isopropylmalate dehydratase large subunit [Deltaproteobacteria bacterium]RLB02888.1 MAG: 3-isopropylmalate dehydratase large subunit [Deltaproteobacteria bacterium]